MRDKTEISAASARLSRAKPAGQGPSKSAASKAKAAPAAPRPAAGTPDANIAVGELLSELRRALGEGAKRMAGLFDDAASALRAVLDLSARRQGVIAANVANKDTPGYRAKDVDFASELRAAIDGGADRVTLSRTAQGHIAPAAGAATLDPAVVEREGAPFRPDGNTVDIDREMLSLGENAMAYNAALQLLAKKIALLRYAVGDGGNR